MGWCTSTAVAKKGYLSHNDTINILFVVVDWFLQMIMEQ